MNVAQEAALASLRDKRRRWQTRLTRATNMLAKLARQEARLMKPPRPVVVSTQAVEAVKGLEIPDFLDRSNPVIAAQMTAQRKAAEAEARKAMPLVGRDALKVIKRKK